MAVNLYDYANQLEQALRDSDEYKAIKDAFSKVKDNEESKIIRWVPWNSIKFPTKQMQGEEIPEEDLAKAQEQAQAIEKDENISELMQAEQKWAKYSKKLTKSLLNL